MRNLLSALFSTGVITAFMPTFSPSDEPLDVVEFEDSLADVERPPDIRQGKYIAECQDIQKGVSANKGNEYYAIKLMIPNEELGQDIQEHYPDGFPTNWNRQLVPKGNDRRTLYNLRKLVEAFGLDSNTTSFDPNDLMGRKVTVVMGPGPVYQGERRMEVKSLELAPDNGPAPTRGGRNKAAAEEENETTTRKGKPAARGRSARR